LHANKATNPVGYWAVFAIVEVLLVFDIILRLLMREQRRGEKLVQVQNEGGEYAPLLRGASHVPETLESREDDTSVSDCAEQPERPNGSSRQDGWLDNLGLNWASSIMVTTVVVTIRCGLEAVSVRS
jgi:hypothetical protein